MCLEFTSLSIVIDGKGVFPGSRAFDLSGSKPDEKKEEDDSSMKRFLEQKTFRRGTFS
jgi:hypothetical protein